MEADGKITVAPVNGVWEADRYCAGVSCLKKGVALFEDVPESEKDWL